MKRHNVVMYTHGYFIVFNVSTEFKIADVGVNKLLSGKM